MVFDGEQFSELIKQRGLTTLDIINKLKDNYNIEITIDTMKSYRRKSSKNATPSLDKLKAFAEILGVTIDELSGGNKISPIKMVPIVGNASCGACETNSSQIVNMKQAISHEDWTKDLYAVVANGDSMATEIYDGDICIVDPKAQVQNGDIVFYKIDDEVAIKIYVKDEEAYLMSFVPFNASECFRTKNIRMDDEETMSRLTVHKVVQVVSTKRNNRAARLKMIGRN